MFRIDEKLEYKSENSTIMTDNTGCPRTISRFLDVG